MTVRSVKKFLEFFCNILWKTMNEFFGQPNISMISKQLMCNGETDLTWSPLSTHLKSRRSYRWTTTKTEKHHTEYLYGENVEYPIDLSEEDIRQSYYAIALIYLSVLVLPILACKLNLINNYCTNQDINDDRGSLAFQKYLWYKEGKMQLFLSL